MIWATLMQAFWRNEPSKGRYNAVSVATSPLGNAVTNDSYDDVIYLKLLDRDVEARRHLLEESETGSSLGNFYYQTDVCNWLY